MCMADREITTGYCGVKNTLRVARAALHFWEEPCISGEEGSGAVFFTGCNLRCVFCQNYQIARAEQGKEITIERLAEIFLELQEQKANNINLVTATHYVPQVVLALKDAKKNGEAAQNDSILAVVKKTFPMFILWFVVMAGLNTFGFFSATGISLLGKLGKYLFAAALAGVGFKIKFKDVFSKGLKPIALGGITWICVAISSYAFAFLFAKYIG